VLPLRIYAGEAVFDGVIGFGLPDDDDATKDFLRSLFLPRRTKTGEEVFRGVVGFCLVADDDCDMDFRVNL
jgi:hypothetical protein